MPDTLLPSPEEDPKVNGAVVTGLNSFFSSVSIPPRAIFVSCEDDVPNEKEGAETEELPIEAEGAAGAEELSSLWRFDVGSSFFSTDIVDEPKLKPPLAVDLLSFAIFPAELLLGLVDPKVKAARAVLLPASLGISGALALAAPNVKLLTSAFFSSLGLEGDELDAPNVKLVAAGMVTSSFFFSESLEEVAVPNVNGASVGLLSSSTFLSLVLAAPNENPPAPGLLISSFFAPVAPNLKPLDSVTGVGEEIVPNVKLFEDSVDFAVAAPNVKVLDDGTLVSPLSADEVALPNEKVLDDGPLVSPLSADEVALPNEKEGVVVVDDGSIFLVSASEDFSFFGSSDSFGVSQAGHLVKCLSY